MNEQENLPLTIAIRFFSVFFLFSFIIFLTPKDCLSWTRGVEARIGNDNQKNQANGSFPNRSKANASFPDESTVPTFYLKEDHFSSHDGHNGILEKGKEHRTRRKEGRCSSSSKVRFFRILYGPSSLCKCPSHGLRKLASKHSNVIGRYCLNGKCEKHSASSSVCDVESAKLQHGISLESDVSRRCNMNDDVVDNNYENDVPGNDKDVIGHGQSSNDKENLIYDEEKKIHGHLYNVNRNVHDVSKTEADMGDASNESKLKSHEKTQNETNSIVTNSSKIHLRQEIDGGLYNYASDAKGAKVLSSNKEAKGASNILNKDKDKYFWSPCNAENKYIDLELSEETLVVEIVITNYEFYSSSVRDFELLGSSIYPAEEWTLLGKFEAENGRISQNFTLIEPKWARYLRVQIVSSYGSDFYCTLSVLEVHGVDAIEWLLEEWFAEEGYSMDQKDELASNHLNDDMDSSKEGWIQIMEEKKSRTEYQLTNRLGLDAVMKLMMQKIRSLEHNQPHLFQLKELDDQYREILNLYMNELSLIKDKLEEAAVKISGLNALLRMMEQKRYEEKQELETEFLNHIGTWTAELDLIRSEVKKAKNKEIVALAIALLSVLFVVLIHIFMFCMSLFKRRMHDNKDLVSFVQILWIVPFLSATLVVFVLS